MLAITIGLPQAAFTQSANPEAEKLMITTSKKEPFIRTREVILYCPNSDIWNAMTPELKQKYFMC